MDLLEEYKQQFEKEIDALIVQMGEKTKLRDACEYALCGEGKRIRPLMTLALADSIGKNYDVIPSALAVECFHTASLIADDLPSMDNEEMRRNRPTLHRIFGESLALLTSYTLIATGYEMLGKNATLLPDPEYGNRICVMALQIVSHSAGISGATNGQFLDLSPPNTSLETILKIIYQKTVTLFEVSFSLGWLFGGGDKTHLEEIKKCAYHFGMAFQIADDLQDIEQDKKNSLSLNIAVALGSEYAQEQLQKELNIFSSLMKKLKIDTPIFQCLRKRLLSSVQPIKSCI